MLMKWFQDQNKKLCLKDESLLHTVEFDKESKHRAN